MNCEEVCIAATAMAEGCEPSIPAAEVEAHLKACAWCREELEELRGVTALLGRQTRRERTGQVWPAVALRFEGRVPRPLIALPVVLVAWKLIELVPDRSFPLAFQLVPLLIGIAVFVCLKVNPFRIETQIGERT